MLRKSPIKLLTYPWYLLCLPDVEAFSGSHFDPRSRLFDDSQRLRGAVSSVAVGVWLGITSPIFVELWSSGHSPFDDHASILNYFFNFESV